MACQQSDDGSAESNPADVQEAKQALEKGFKEVKTPREAAAALDKVESDAGDLKQKDLPQIESSGPEARAVCEAVDGAARSGRPAAALEAVASGIATAPPGQAQALELAVREAAGPDMPSEAATGRALLTRELLKRMKPFDAVDAILFIAINGIPHPVWLDKAMARLTWVMTGGHGWILVLLAGVLVDRRKGLRAAANVLPPLWLSTFIVEVPVKRYFRRRRPFISIVRAIVIGRKPGSYSFPSGHSAAAFAGAALLQAWYPRSGRLFFLLAALVGLSRVYLGAHYPGDVAAGGLSGALLAKGCRALIDHFKDLQASR